jgi:cyclic beta-1,2-glucan synthetase
VSLAHRVLASDPAGAYTGMDFDSRSRYRAELADLAKHGACSEMETAQAAISLCEQARSASDGSRTAVRRTHVGFYLVDRGRAQLEAAIGYRPPMRTRIPRFILRHPTEFYLTAIELITLGIVFGILYKLGSITPAYAGLLLVALPATQAAMDFVRNLSTFLAWIFAANLR